MFSLRKSAPLLAGAALVLSLAACGGSGDAQPAASGAASSGGAAAAGGTISIITVDPSNPYWKAEADTAKAAVEKLGYKAVVSANNNDPETQNQLVETAINDKVAGILLDPAGADESVAAVQKAGGPKLDRRLITLPSPIKSLGSHTVTVKVHPEVEATVTLEVRLRV